MKHYFRAKIFVVMVMLLCAANVVSAQVPARVQRGKARVETKTDGSVEITTAPGKSLSINGVTLGVSELQSKMFGSFTRSALPTPSAPGRIAQVTDGVRGLWVDTGTAWIPLGDGVNVKLFGAKGDGLTNDQPAIQSAIDATAAAGGDKVLFPNGRYRVDSTVNLKSNVILVGQTQGGVEIFKPGAGVGDIVVRALGTFETNANAPLNAGFGIGVRDARLRAFVPAARGARVIRLTNVADMAGLAVGQDIGLTKGLFNPADDNTDFEPFLFNKIVGLNPTSGDIELSENVRNPVVGNLVKLTSVIRNIGIHNINFRMRPDGFPVNIVFKYVDGAQMSGLRFDWLSTEGFGGIGNFVASRRIVFRDSYMNRAHVALHSVTDSLFTNNKSLLRGYELEAGCENVEISGNTITDAVGPAMITVETGSWGNRILNNQIINRQEAANTGMGIRIKGFDYRGLGENLVVNNTIHGAFEAGIFLDGFPEHTANNLVTDNSIIGSKYGVISYNGAIGSQPATASAVINNQIRATVGNYFDDERAGAFTGLVNPGKTGFNNPSGALGDVNAGAEGFYSFRSAERHLGLKTNGGANEIVSTGAPLYLNYNTAQNVALFGATPGTLFVNGQINLTGTFPFATADTARFVRVRAGANQTENAVEVRASNDTTTAAITPNGGAAFNTLALGGGTVVRRVLSATGALDFASTAAQSSTDLTITVAGAEVGDVVQLGVPPDAVPAGAIYAAWVSANDTVTVRVGNLTAAAIDPAAGTFRVAVTKF